MVSPNDATSVTRVLDGRYRLAKLLGHGGMGSVYEAVHIHTEKRVAVKLLSSSLSKDLKLVARFQREAKAASQIDHENCVHIDEFGEDKDGTFYIAMELIDGHGLADELRKSGPMPAERVARIGAQLLKALDAAHAVGVLHRDLKPQNVMLTQKPHRPDLVKVVDFGIAKITKNTAEDQSALTVPGTIFGTPEYMSPEQARGETLDQRSDIYSAAVVLWHLLLGRSPFRGTSVRETLMKVFADEPPSPTVERPGTHMPPGFEAVLKKAMAKKKEERFVDAASFLEALAPFVTGGVEVPRRPLPGLAADGQKPPQTIDDNPNRSATLAIPDDELAPLQHQTQKPAQKPVSAPTSAESATRFGALPTLAIPEQDNLAAGRARVVSVDERLAAKRPTQSASLETEEASVAPRHVRPKLSAAAVIVLVIAALGVCGILVGAYFVLEALNTGKVRVSDPRVATLPDRDKPTAHELEKKHDEAVEQIGDAPPDPVARDAALARGEQAMTTADFKGAAKAYDEAINADPFSASAHAKRAVVAMMTQDYVKAAEHYEQAMALDPKYARDRTVQQMYAKAKQLSTRTPP